MLTDSRNEEVPPVLFISKAGGSGWKEPMVFLIEKEKYGKKQDSHSRYRSNKSLGPFETYSITHVHSENEHVQGHTQFTARHMEF